MRPTHSCDVRSSFRLQHGRSRRGVAFVRTWSAQNLSLVADSVDIAYFADFVVDGQTTSSFGKTPGLILEYVLHWKIAWVVVLLRLEMNLEVKKMQWSYFPC